MKREEVPLEVELQPDTKPDARTQVEREEDWLYFHLSCAAQARNRLARLKPGQQFDHELHTRRLAIAGALKHLALLVRMGSALPPLLENMMRSEGL